MTDDPASRLAQHVRRTGYADLPASAVELARRDILDTFGCMLGGSGSPGIGELRTIGEPGGCARADEAICQVIERYPRDLEWPAIEGRVRLFQSIDRYVPAVDPMGA